MFRWQPKKLYVLKTPNCDILFFFLSSLNKDPTSFCGIFWRICISQKSQLIFFSFEMLNRFLNKTSLDVFLKNSCGCQSVSLIARRTFTLIAVAWKYRMNPTDGIFYQWKMFGRDFTMRFIHDFEWLPTPILLKSLIVRPRTWPTKLKLKTLICVNKCKW
jgi:hypothetical protein